jgi:hypothetical protein
MKFDSILFAVTQPLYTFIFIELVTLNFIYNFILILTKLIYGRYYNPWLPASQ